jgi:hypothetical protein
VPDHLAKAYEHYGIDPSTYSDKYVHGSKMCWICGMHYTSMPIPRCDLERARADEMRQLGFEAGFCLRCSHAYPRQVGYAGCCPSCNYKLDRGPHAPSAVSAGAEAYVPDGAGCVEKLPRWMVDWDGNPGHEEPR